MLATAPPREVILARVLPVRRAASGPLLDEHALQDASRRLNDEREHLLAAGITARSVAFLSPRPADDVVRLAERQDVDLALLDGRRALFGGGPLGGEIGGIFDRAPCDVAVLVERKQGLALAPDRPIIVPFGAGDHDWAALELGAWLASTTHAPLRLLGTAAEPAAGRPDASRMLADASLVVQQVAGVSAEPLLVERGEGVVRAGRDAGLMVIGLPDDWRTRGLGGTRTELALSDAPTLFVRRGRREGALAPRESMTRFTWSSYGKTVAGEPAGTAR